MSQKIPSREVSTPRKIFGSADLENSLKEIKKRNYNNNVKDFGADPTGTEDSTVAIQNALNSKNVIYFPEGVYLFSEDINFNENNFIFGDGENKTIFKSQSNDASFSAIDVSNITIKNIEFDFNHYAGDLNFQSKDETATKDMENIKLEDVYVHDSGNSNNYSHNIVFKTFSNYNIKKISLNRVKAENAFGDGKGYGDNLYIASYGGDGLGQLKDVFVNNCRFEKAGRQNISLAGKDSNIPTNIIIDNCILIDSSLAGIDPEDAENVIINNCYFIRSGTYQGYFENTVHVAETSPGSTMQGGISFHGYAEDSRFSISNCHFTDCYYGISGGNKAVINNCVFENSKIANGSAASGGLHTFLGCRFITDNSVNYAFKT